MGRPRIASASLLLSEMVKLARGPPSVARRVSAALQRNGDGNSVARGRSLLSALYSSSAAWLDEHAAKAQAQTKSSWPPGGPKPFNREHKRMARTHPFTANDGQWLAAQAAQAGLVRVEMRATYVKGTAAQAAAHVPYGDVHC